MKNPFPGERWEYLAPTSVPTMFTDYMQSPKGALALPLFKKWKKNPLKGLHPSFLKPGNLGRGMKDWSYLFLQANGSELPVDL